MSADMRINRRFGQVLGVTVGVTALVIGLAVPAGASRPADFDAPIFGTTGTLTALRMPTVADVVCTDGQCTQGVLPANVFIDPAKYLSPTVAAGGAFATAPGFIAKVNKGWDSFDPTTSDQSGRLNMILAEFAPGGDVAAVVAADAAIMQVPITGPTVVNGVETWRGGNTDADGGFSMVYASLGTMLARGTCSYAASLQSQNACGLDNIASLLVSAVQRPAPATVSFTRAVRALVPATPSNLTPVVMSAEKSALVWSMFKPAPAITKALATTQSALMQYQVKGFPTLYLMATAAPFKGNADGLLKKVCEPWGDDCRSSVMSGPEAAYLATVALQPGSKKVVALSALAAGGGRIASIDCTTVNLDRGLTAKERGACTKALAGLSRAIVR